MNTLLRLLRVAVTLAGLAAAGSALAGPVLAAFQDDIARDLGMKTATLVAPVGAEWIIDLAASDGIQAGDLFAVMTRGAPVVHPVNKQVIGSLEEVRAVLRVTRVKPYYSYAVVISSAGELESGAEARRFAGLTALFRDYTGAGEGVFTQVQGALPGLHWQGYAAAQSQPPEQTPPVTGMPPGLIFVLDARGLAVTDHQRQQLRFYRADQLAPGPVPAAVGIGAPMTAAPGPVGAAGMVPGDRPTAAVRPDRLAVSAPSGGAEARPAPQMPGEPVSSEGAGGTVAGGAPPAGSPTVPAAAPAPLPVDAGEPRPDSAVEPPPPALAELPPVGSGSPDASPAVPDSLAAPQEATGEPRPVPAELPLPAGAGGESPVTLAADQLEYDSATGAYRATGAVILEQGDTRLAADELLWQATTRDAVASGQVSLSEPAGELQGTSLHASLATGLGLVSQGRGLLRERNFHLAGAEIERLGEASYRIKAGSFTTCDGELPDWQFTAGRIDVELGRYAVARDVWFEVRDQPLLYLPYLVFPVKSERESGFLIPRVGYSSRKGALLSLAWYEVIDRHLDATVYVDYLSRLGLGTGLEYRYALGADNLGEARYYHVSGIDDSPDSYAIAWRHGGTLPGTIRLTADVEYVNRIEFFEDFGEAPEEYNQDHTISTVMLQRNWGKLNLTGFARYIKDLENDNDATLQILPEFGLTVPRYQLDGPLYSRTELLTTNFSREAGEDGARVFLRQGLGATLKPGSWLEFTPEVAVYGRYYHADGGEETDLLPEYSAAVSTRLVRVFPFARWGIERLQHSIEPQVSYLYIPNQDQDELPMFDRRDRIGPRNQVGYALVNRLTARKTGADGVPVYRELLNLRLSQAYDVRAARDDDTDDPEPFTDLRTELTLRSGASGSLEIDALTRVHDDLQFSRFNAAASFDDRHGNLARLSYFYRNAKVPMRTIGDAFGTVAEAPGAGDYLRLDLATSLFDPLHVGVSERYDFEDGEALETVLGLEYRARCWSLFLTFRDRPGEEEFLVGFALSGLGRVGGFGSELQSRRDW